MGKIVQIGEHQWRLPDPPKSQNDVLFVKEKKDNQFWQRQVDIPRFFYQWDSETRLFADHTQEDDLGQLISLNREDSKEFLRFRERELMRRCLGVWFMNNGELTHLTGGHYFFLQWAQMLSANEENGSPYGNFREFQADLAYFLQMCKEDNNSIGGYVLKPKKSGVTQFVASDFVDESTRMRGRWFGVMSKVQVPDCRDTNFAMYKNILENLPNVMKPAIANENLTMIYYGNPVNNKNQNRKSRTKQNGNLDWLNTRVTALPTKDNAFDGGKPFRAWLDEFPKYADPYPKEVFKKTAPTVKMARIVTGKMWGTSYSPETDDKSFEQAKKIILESFLETLNPNTKRTKSEMYLHFISSLDCAEGSFDKFGRTDKAGNKIWISQQLEQRKGDKAAIQSFIRQNPTTIEEALRAGGTGGSIFNTIRLDAKKTQIKKDQAVGKYRFKECNLHWTGKRGASGVRIDEITEDRRLNGEFGNWRMWGMEYWRQDNLNLPFLNDNRDHNGKLLPDKNNRRVISMDPTNYKSSSDVLAESKNSIWVFDLPDTVWNSRWQKQVTNRPIASYFFRHDKPSDTYDDIKRAIYLWGCPIVIEGNMPTWVTMLIEDELENFILIKDSRTKAIVPYNATEHKAMLTTQGGKSEGTINELIAVTQEWLGEPKPGDFDNLDNLDCEIVLDQLIRLNSVDTKKFDHAMGFMWGILAMASMDAYFKRLLDMQEDYSTETMLCALNALDN